MKKEDIQKVLQEADIALGNYSDKQNQWFDSPKLKNNGRYAATEVNNKQGEKNAQSGHMKEIQKLGCSIGGTISGNNKSKEKLIEIGKLGNEVNQQVYGDRIIATNLITGECWEYISKHEAERDTGIPTCTIRKILRGLQPKTRCGWTFSEK
jgi:hypothetical protein